MAGNILVTGGAGYIGSHTCLALAEAGYTPIVFDNLSNGHREFAQWGPFVEGDIRDEVALKQVMDEYSPIGVIHFAALIEVGESVKRPGPFYANNVGGAITLINVAREAGVKAFVFSSTCATYGEPQYMPMDEAHPQKPINPYGHSKLMIEQVLADLRTYSGFPSIALRYFNAAGSDPEGRVGEWHDPETHAIPIALDNALGLREGFRVMGTDYDTRDGSCIRDYIHVLDLADAHICALNHLLNGGEGGAYNLGTGTGTSVIELVNAIRRVTGKAFDAAPAERRAGDAPVLVANNAKATSDLGWTPRHSLDDIIETAWAWHVKLRGA
ncbi:MAG: UDP-glucose 4-epimerase GalE [Ponticaulis sp.]|nr:UDP-glucose 4-epimerase GalE [Ponticaulis sp.]|tara:strand:+ start:48198 stop:49178 length:981 start_codon:yes stop_codon:yes gene_type:complete